MKKESDIEKRRFLRQPINLTVTFSVLGKSAEAKGTVVNVSEEGFCLITKYPLQEGQRIAIKGDARDQIPSYGIVKWVRESNSSYMVGFQLLRSVNKLKGR